MKKRFFIQHLCLNSFCFFTSCDDDGDTTKPTINLIYPEEGAYLQIGEAIYFKAEFTDNEMLGSYKIEIHNNLESPHDHDSDNHDHVHAMTKSEADQNTYFSFNQDWDLSGLNTTTEEHYNIVIPANTITGNYHLIVYCFDAVGNETYVARSINLIDGESDHGHEHEDHDDHVHDH